MADFYWLGSGDIGSFNWTPQPDPLHPIIPGPADNAHFVGGGGTLTGVLDVAGVYFEGGQAPMRSLRSGWGEGQMQLRASPMCIANG